MKILYTQSCVQGIHKQQRQIDNGVGMPSLSSCLCAVPVLHAQEAVQSVSSKLVWLFELFIVPILYTLLVAVYGFHVSLVAVTWIVFKDAKYFRAVFFFFF